MSAPPTQSRAALVTGASYGIGAATAIGLAEDGFDVAITDLTTAPLAKTQAAIEALGRQCVALALDLRDQASVERTVADAAGQLDGLAVLVNNAGVPSPSRPALEITREVWDAGIAVNLTGTFFMAREMGRYLIAAARPGAIISLASTHGVVGFAGTAPYGIAKAGISHMSRILAVEWAPHNIRVNAVAPGTTPTESRAPSLADPKRRETMINRVPLKRLAEVSEVAGAIRYLASPQAAYITGQTLVVDGGLTAY
ncbi:MAG: SDR family oxidoreductase [Alphaproteobacteria bacterium]|nr:SDR family oxidoreductase [Alphaproteobacteria bacterium]